jgi:hypothetical protein
MCLQLFTHAPVCDLVVGLDNIGVVEAQHELHLVLHSLAALTVMLNALDRNLKARPATCACMYVQKGVRKQARQHGHQR